MGTEEESAAGGSILPRFVADTAWQLRVPPGRLLGPVVGLGLTPQGHIWVMHITQRMDVLPQDARDRPELLLPPVVEFAPDGTFLRAWGGPSHLPKVNGRAQWPKQEETLSIDDEGAIWVFGANKEYDHAVQRFTPDGKLLLRIGEFGVPGNDESRDRLGGPTDAYHDVQRREVYISDGYVNHRVAVFNSDTGAFLRAWGAYGKVPPFPTEGPRTFNTPVHAISRGPDGLLYVCDRKNNRIQVFDAIGRAEARFVREIEIREESLHGTTFNVAFTPDGDFMFVADGNNNRIWTVNLHTWKIVDSFAGPDEALTNSLPTTIHKIVTDRAGNLWLGYTQRGVAKLRFTGYRRRAADAD
jgi:DNA-binding beta-propeller fold protein YncE